MNLCSCQDGFTGPYCASVMSSTSRAELSLMASLGALLPLAAIVVVIMAAFYVYSRTKSSANGSGSRDDNDDVNLARDRSAVLLCYYSNNRIRNVMAVSSNL